MDRPSIGPRRSTVRAALWLAAWLLSGCGGQAPTAPPAPEPTSPEPIGRAGTVSVANHTTYDLEVTYLNETDADAPRIVRTRVPAGTRVEVSGGVLPAGLAVEFDVVLVPHAADGIRVRRKIQVAIDGDWVLNVRLVDESDPFSLEIASASP
jgi:hypothetical protein